MIMTPEPLSQMGFGRYGILVGGTRGNIETTQYVENGSTA